MPIYVQSKQVIYQLSLYLLLQCLNNKKMVKKSQIQSFIEGFLYNKSSLNISQMLLRTKTFIPVIKNSLIPVLNFPFGSQRFFPKQEYAFYKTFIDQECRKDILTENQHINKKIKNRITSRFERLKNKSKENKYRIWYFFGFVVLFKLQPIYEYFFCDNMLVNWIYHNLIDYYLDGTKKIPSSIPEVLSQRKLIQNSSTNKSLSEIFYHFDRNPNLILGYDSQTQSFLNMKNTTIDNSRQISLSEFIKLCNKNSIKPNDVEVLLGNLTSPTPIA